MLPEPNFIVFFVILHTLEYCILYGCGRLVQDYDVRVNYTRKIYHISAFVLPVVIRDLLPHERTPVTGVWDLLSVTLWLVVMTKPIRSRIPIVGMFFKALDRPEDRPHTLLWLSTQIVGMILVMIPLGIYLHHMGYEELIYIPIIINAFGDGLAEPVGVRFGRHKYKTHALFTKRKYTRSLEGSACVLVSGFVAVAVLHASFTPPQLLAAFLTIPIIMTLTEAWSPHTWDTPFLFLVGGVLVGLIKNLV